MAEGKLFVKRDGGEYIPFGEVKEPDFLEILDPNDEAPTLQMYGEGMITFTIDGMSDFFKKYIPSRRKCVMVARRAAKKAARLKRKEFYLWRIREETRNRVLFGFGTCKKKLPLPKWKWSYTIEQIRRF